ncbi:MAG: hypothetical protein J2P45_08525 [Candidatus Dormibacteraeota bacterium]|nr:hypothetical protein [Candidatus Dormibacteraeota bacterium]
MLPPEPTAPGGEGDSGAFGRLLGMLAALTAPVLALEFLFRNGLALRVWLIAVGALVSGWVANRALRHWPVATPARRRLRGPIRRRPPSERPRQLEELERAVDFSTTTAFDLHFRLRPHLVRIAAHRLAARGLSLEGRPERARALLGAETWELVRPDRRPPEDRDARGLELAAIRRAVEQLEGL